MKNSRKRSKNSGIIHLELVLAVSIIAIFIVFGLARHKTYTEKELPASYAAWVKHTGNPNHLTFEEWKALTNAEHRVYNTHNRDY